MENVMDNDSTQESQDDRTFSLISNFDQVGHVHQYNTFTQNIIDDDFFGLPMHVKDILFDVKGIHSLYGNIFE